MRLGNEKLGTLFGVTGLDDSSKRGLKRFFGDGGLGGVRSECSGALWEQDFVVLIGLFYMSLGVVPRFLFFFLFPKIISSCVLACI